MISEPVETRNGAADGDGRRMIATGSRRIRRSAMLARFQRLTPLSLLLVLCVAYFLFRVQSVIVLLLAGILLATILSGPVEWLHRRWHIRRTLAIPSVFLLVLAGLSALILVIAPPLTREVGLFAAKLPDLLRTWRAEFAASDNRAVRIVGERLFDLIGGGTDQEIALSNQVALRVTQDAGGAIVALFSIVLIAVYWMVEKARIKRAIAGVTRGERRRRFLRQWRAVEQTVGAWMRGELVLMTVIGTLVAVAYGLLGIPFWLLLGVIAGLTEAIPNIGPILGAIPAVLLALTVDVRLALAVIAFVILLQALENAILVPRVMRSAVGLLPLVVILAILAGAAFAGVAGALLAVPVAAVIQTVVRDLRRVR